ncbi:MAG: hypothetical protein M1434_07035 [Chloroflexi bacterium]|nr:hypothetical protein [Chloroflexota bacterium]MCL5274485.1 hypothetical protein [Chloroflexota bacterium]
MNVLLTGAFGNIGRSTLGELAGAGHRVRCFDLPTRSNLKVAEVFSRRYGDQLQTVWGDLRRPDDVSAAVRDQAVGHGRRVGGSPRLGARDQRGRHAEPHHGHEATARAAAPADHVVVPRVRPDGGPTPPRTVWDPVQPCGALCPPQG